MPWNKKKSYNLLKSDKKKVVHLVAQQQKDRNKNSFAFFKHFISKLIKWFNTETSKTSEC